MQIKLSLIWSLWEEEEEEEEEKERETVFVGRQSILNFHLLPKRVNLSSRSAQQLVQMWALSFTNSLFALF